MKPSTFAHFVSSLLYEKRCGHRPQALPLPSVSTPR